MKHTIPAGLILCIISISSCREKPASGPTMVNRQYTLPTGNPSATPASSVLPAGNSSAKLNPAHGQPGHRCDIAVGAPLPASGPAATPAVPTANLNTNSQPAAGNTTPVGSNKPGLNPAHGQPGHRCDIAVGAPLDSKPATTSNSSTKPATATTSALPTDTLFAKGLNPAHGQPGHRCDIAVGAPLNKPAKADTIPSTIAAPEQQADGGN